MKSIEWIRAKLPLWMPGSTKASLENCAHLPLEKLTKIAKQNLERQRTASCTCKAITAGQIASKLIQLAAGSGLVYISVLMIHTNNAVEAGFGAIFLIAALISLAGNVSQLHLTFRRNACSCAASRQLKDQDIIPTFLYRKLKDKVDKILQGELQKNKRSVTEVLQELKTVSSYLTGRISGYARAGKSVPPYIQDAHRRAEDLLARLETKRSDLEQHEAKMKAFLKTSKAHIDGLKEPLADHTVIAQLNELSDRVEHTENEAERVIAGTAAELQLSLSEISDECNRLFEQTGIEIAASQPTITLLAQTVEDFVPADDHLGTLH